MTEEGGKQLISAKRYSLLSGIIGFTSYWSFFIYWAATTKKDLGGAYLAWAILIVLLSEGVLSIYDKKIKFVGPTGLGILIAWCSEVTFTLNFPDISPASHQLLPLEPIIYMFAIVPTSLVGSVCGKIIANKLVCKLTPVNATRMIHWLFITGFILALLSPIATPLQKAVQEHKAKVAIIEMTRAQFSYYKAHPDEGFTCSLSKLIGGKSYTYNNQRGTYEAQYEWGYAYRLMCDSSARPRKTFFLSVSPTHVATGGDIAYCSDESGLVRSTPRRNKRYWSEKCRESKNVISKIIPSGQL